VSGVPAWFGVISEQQEQRLTEILAKYPDFFLLKAAAYLDAGLIDDAERELNTPAGRDSDLALKLAARVAAIRSVDKGPSGR
jgi:hypothetical protein